MEQLKPKFTFFQLSSIIITNINWSSLFNNTFRMPALFDFFKYLFVNVLFFKVICSSMYLFIHIKLWINGFYPLQTVFILLYQYSQLILVMI